MTPKEKAKELVENFQPMMYCYLGSGMLTNTIDFDVSYRNARLAAKMAVQEILNLDYGDAYWDEVMNEIEVYDYKTESK